MKKTKIVNQPAPVTAPKINKFWNFIDNGRTADLQLFGTISSEEDWWSDDCVTYRNFINELNALGDKDEINVTIQSGGGDVFAANAIYNALVINKAKITGTIIGLCASAATIVLMACDIRRIAKNAVLMAHNPKISLRGQYESAELLKLADVTDQVKKSIIKAYTERLEKTEEEIKQLMDEESWYVGQEAVDAGFCDEVIETQFQNNAFTNNLFMVDGVSYSFTNYIENFVPDDIRKKVQDLSKTPQKETGTFFNTKNSSQKGSSDMGQTQNPAAPTITNAAQLRSAYPDFVNEIIEDALKAERERLKAIDSISSGISDDVLKKAKYDEPISAADLALAQMQANSKAGQQTMTNIVEDLTNSGAGSVGAVPNAGNDTSQQKAEQKEEKVRGFANALNKDKRRGTK